MIRIVLLCLRLLKTKEDVMREIKFRVWDKINKEYSKLLVFDAESSGVVLSGGKYGRHSALKENVIIEQYTSFKDCNDKEIYEGDMIPILFEDWSSREITEVNGVVVEIFGGWHLKFIHPETKKQNYSELFKLLKKNPEKEITGTIHDK